MPEISQNKAWEQQQSLSNRHVFHCLNEAIIAPQSNKPLTVQGGTSTVAVSGQPKADSKQTICPAARLSFRKQRPPRTPYPFAMTSRNCPPRKHQCCLVLDRGWRAHCMPSYSEAWHAMSRIIVTPSSCLMLSAVQYPCSVAFPRRTRIVHAAKILLKHFSLRLGSS